MIFNVGIVICVKLNISIEHLIEFLAQTWIIRLDDQLANTSRFYLLIYKCLLIINKP